MLVLPERENEKTYLVFFLQLQNTWQVNDGPFHTIQAFDNKENLLPGTMRLRLALTYNFPEERLERLHVVMFENSHTSSAESCAKTNRGMIALIRDEKAPFRNKRRDDRRVGCKTHRGNKCVLLANKTSDEGFPDHV